MKLASTRAMARMAWRDARRNRWRSLLVVAMIGVPTLGMTTAAVILATMTPTAEEQATGEMGNADLAIFDDTLTPEQLSGRLPGVALSVRYLLEVNMIAAGAYQYVPVEDIDPGDPILGPIYQLTSGLAPAEPGEIAVSPAVLESFVVDVGDSITLGEESYRIVGTIVKPEHLNDVAAVVAPGSLTAIPDAYRRGVYLKSPDDASRAQIEELLNTGEIASYQVRENYSLGTDSSLSSVGLASAIAAVVLAETGLIAAAAFVVGARRQLRTIGIVGATGGEPRHTRALVLTGGALLGLVGSIGGVVLGLGMALALSPFLDRFAGRITGALTVPLLLPLAAIILGTTAATLAAFAPARSAARIATMDALAGRTPPPRPAGRLARYGLVGVALGLTLTAVATASGNDIGLIGGVFLTVGGFLFAIPYLVTLTGRLATRLPLAARIAARDTARHGRRTGAAVAAATVALVLPVGVATATLSADAQRNALVAMADDQLVVEIPWGDLGVDADDPQAFIDQIEGTVLPGAVSALVTMAFYSERYALPDDVEREEFLVFSSGPPRQVDEGVIETVGEPVTLGGLELLHVLHADSFADQLNDGVAIVTRPYVYDNGVVHIDDPTATHGDGGNNASFDIPAVDATSGFLGSGYLPGLVLSFDRAAELGFEPGPVHQIVIRAAAPITADQLAAAKAVAAGFPAFSVTGLDDTRWEDTGLRNVILAFTATIALAIIAVAVALISAESRRDRAILAAIGASPRTRRAMAGSRALLLTALAGILAVPAGFLPVIAIQLASREDYPFVVPWVAIATICIGLPLVAGGAAIALSRRPPAAQMLRPLF